MARVCSICTHTSRHAIERSLVDEVPYRTIADRHGVSKTALIRHKTDHLAQLLANHVPEEPDQPGPATGPIEPQTVHAIRRYAGRRSAEEELHAVDVFGELLLQLDRLGKLYDALERWLADPDDPTRYSIDPRSDEIMVIFEDWNDTTEAGTPKRKRARLSHLLQAVANLSGGQYQAISGETKYADPRELLVKVSAELRAQMQLRVNIIDKLTGAQEVARFKTAVLDALAEVDPDVRRRVEANLRRRQPLL